MYMQISSKVLHRVRDQGSRGQHSKIWVDRNGSCCWISKNQTLQELGGEVGFFTAKAVSWKLAHRYRYVYVCTYTESENSCNKLACMCLGKCHYWSVAKIIDSHYTVLWFTVLTYWYFL